MASNDSSHASLLTNKAKALLNENKFNLDAILTLVKDAQEEHIEFARETFELLVHEFFTCGRFWKVYIEKELNSKNYQRVEELFKRCIDKVLQIDLWKCYLTYIKEITPFQNTQESREKIFSAYDQALEQIGLDVMSYSIWLDYINYVKSLEPIDLFTEDEKITKIRDIYLDGISNPMINVEQFWKDFASFESQFNPSSPKIILDDTNKEFVNVKRVAREYENVTRPLERHVPAIPPQGTNDELKQILSWKRYIAWEKQNPLKSDDKIYVLKRVMFAYEQSFLCLAYHPDIWLEAAAFLIEQSKSFLEAGIETESNKCADDAARLYDRATNTFMKHNTLLYLVYADFEENRQHYTKCEEIYKKCLDNTQNDTTLVYIHYMRFMRRIHGIKAARDVFKLGRADRRVSYQLYIAAAEMEYYCTKDKTVALKIFQLGADKFPNSHDFMLHYIKYMDHLNEDNNTRVLYERILTNNELSKEGVNQIWSKFLDFECYCGDLASVLKVDKKRQKALENLTDLDKYDSNLIIDRYKFFDLLPCNTAELKSMSYKDIKTPASLASTNVSTTSTTAATTTTTVTQPITSKLINLTSLYAANINLFNELGESASFKLKSKYPVPDEMQMLPFKPVRNALPGMHSVPGGIFPFPPAVTELVKKLPPPNIFQGPFVIIDELMKRFRTAELNEDFTPNYVYITGDAMKDIDHLGSHQHHVYKRSTQQYGDFGSKRQKNIN